MSRARAVTEAKISRVLKALATAGQTVARVELKPDGAVVIVPSTGEAIAAEVSDLDAWRAKRAARQA